MLGDWKTFYTAYLLGKSVVGAHAEDILCAARWAAHYKTDKIRDVHLIANGKTGVAALHAATVDSSLFKSVVLRGAPREWSKMVGAIEQAPMLTTSVHGALASYDLTDLVPLIGSEKVRFEESSQTGY